MEGLEILPKIVKIKKIDGYKVTLDFNVEKNRIIDFEHFFTHVINVQNRVNDPAQKLLNDVSEFKKIEIVGNTVQWKNTGVEVRGVFYPYDLDPIVLFNNSTVA